MTIRTRILSTLTLICVLLSIQSCGFSLRSDRDMSRQLESVTILGISEYSEIGRMLYAALRQSRVAISNDTKTTTAVLNISQQQFNKRVISLDSLGRANQYELVYELVFRVLNPDGSERLKEQKISLRREFLYDSTLVLAKQEEENRLRQDMLSAAVDQLMRNLYYQFNQSAVTKTP